jgi:di/tricarboxylate transporter
VVFLEQCIRTQQEGQRQLGAPLRPDSLCAQANGTEKKLGAYLMKTCFQTSTISSAMFITAMAANPLAVDLARDALGTTISWGTWALAGLVPGLVCLIATPLILYVLYPPEVKDTPDAPAKARSKVSMLWFKLPVFSS